MTSNEILNLECVVLPPGKRNEAMPDEATTRTMLRIERIPKIIVFHRYVFLVPPCL